MINMSLDDIIKSMPQKNTDIKNRRKVNNLNARGGVQKHQSERLSSRQRSEPMVIDGNLQIQSPGQRALGQLNNRPQNNRRNFDGSKNAQNQGQIFRSNQQDKRSNINRYNNENANNSNNRNSNNNVARLTHAKPFIDDQGNVVVRLKQTDIISVNPAGEVTLNSGGWFTPMTLETMNAALNPAGVQIISLTDNPADGKWQVTHICGTQNFRDGMKLFARGQMTAGRAATVLYALGHGRLIRDLESRNALPNVMPIGDHRPIFFPVGSKNNNPIVMQKNAGNVANNTNTNANHFTARPGGIASRLGNNGSNNGVMAFSNSNSNFNSPPFSSNNGNSKFQQDQLSLAVRAAAASSAAAPQWQNLSNMQSALRMAANFASQMGNMNPMTLAAAAAACKNNNYNNPNDI